jgi:hypothetical protein
MQERLVRLYCIKGWKKLMKKLNESNMEQHSLIGLSIPFISQYGEKDNQGQQAVLSGNLIEKTICGALKSHGCTVYEQFTIDALSIYGKKIKADFMVFGMRQYPNGLIIESRWQDGPGSVDHKFPYMVENIKKRYTHPTIIVYGGKGTPPGSIKWLKNQIDGKHLIDVFSIEEFLSWVIRSL